MSSEFSLAKLYANKWLVDNVLPHLPMHHGHLDTNHPAVRSRTQIAHDVLDFLLADKGMPELWAWYAAYDHVALCQLWGCMTDLPDGIPMYTRDLKQECDRLNSPSLPDQVEGEHNALADARYNLALARALRVITEAS